MTKPNDSTPILDVALLPSLIKPESLAGQTAIVVDALRATTTILTALKNGAEQVLPQPSIESARSAYELVVAQEGQAVLGGERGGKIIEGFHNGNSPIEYTKELIGGKTLVLATTNGTVAMEQCRAANRVLIGAMVNLEAVAELSIDDRLVTVVCSGTDKVITSEDVIFAGAFLDRVIGNRKAMGKPAGQLTDTAQIALNHWLNTKRETEAGKPLTDFFRNARGGINLVKIGHDADVVYAAEINKVPVVAELDLATWSIKLV